MPLRPVRVFFIPVFICFINLHFVLNAVLSLVLTPASLGLLELHRGSFSLLVQFAWAGLNGTVALWWAPKAAQTSVEVVLVGLQMESAAVRLW